MDRYTFLKNLGFRGAALMAVLTSCTHPDDSVVNSLTINAQGQTLTGPNGTTTSTGTTTTQPVTTTVTGTTGGSLGIANPLLTIILANTPALTSAGGYITQGGIVVARISAGVYAAVTQTCSHEPRQGVTFSGNQFYCTVHGAQFDLTGKGTNTLAGRGITAYKTITDGKTLVVYS